MSDRWERLGELAVAGANVQPGQVLMINAEYGQHEAVRAAAAAGYRRGAKFVDVHYFDPYVKRARIELAADDTLGFVPEWLGHARLAHAAGRGARINFAGITAPGILAGLDPQRLGRDHLPTLKENLVVLNERTTNWCIIPAPHSGWAAFLYPELASDDAYERLWTELEHVLRLDEPDPVAAWQERMAVLADVARRLDQHGFDAIHLEGPGTNLTVGLFRSSSWQAAEFSTVEGLTHFPNLPSEEIFTTPDPLRADGHVTATKPLVLKDGSIIRGLRVRFEGGVAVAIDADENGEVLVSHLGIDEGGTRLGELALVDGQGRIGPLGTVFYTTLLDENAASHIALGSAYEFAVTDDDDRARANSSETHVDFMIGSPALDVTGITRGGERVPLLRGGVWQI
jgi:aminopeptidase